MSIKPTSLLKLTLLGLFLVAAPLTTGLLSTVFLVDRLAVQIQTVVQDSTQAVESGHYIVTQTLSMERSAAQYPVLHDETILTRYKHQQSKLKQAINRLFNLSNDSTLSERLSRLLERENELYQKLLKITSDPMAKSEEIAAVGYFSELVQLIPYDVTRMITQESSILNHQVSQVQQLLLWQAAALIPLVLFIMVLFSALISRPLQQLSDAIRQLGAGKLTTTIEVTGPQDFRELGEQLDWLRGQLAALDEQKLQFLHHISHELKTPLSVIREGAGLLRDGITNNQKEEQEVAQILYENSLQLQNQIESLLDFNLALAQDQLCSEKPVDLATLIPPVLKKHQLAVQTRNITIESWLPSTLVCGVPEQLCVIFDNLLSNAIKYSCNGGKVQIKLHQINQEAIVDVIDQGVGIMPEESPHLFEPFFQGKSISSSPLQGTGLGLSIVARYLHLHEGSIKLMESRQGAHFQVSLPLATTTQIADTGNKTCPS